MARRILAEDDGTREAEDGAFDDAILPWTVLDVCKMVGMAVGLGVPTYMVFLAIMWLGFILSSGS